MITRTCDKNGMSILKPENMSSYLLMAFHEGCSCMEGEAASSDE